ncbi:unnamed protein product [Effrenium voratum]|nr:unnamed protein product [Effrenium voratum]
MRRKASVVILALAATSCFCGSDLRPRKTNRTDAMALNRLDERFSAPVFNLKLPDSAELLLSVPGALMGFPHAFFGATPMMLAYLASPAGQGGPALLGATLLALLGGLSFYGGLAQWFDFIKASKVMIFAMPYLCLLAASFCTAAPVAYASLVCASLSVALSIPLKAWSDRRRPAAKLGFPLTKRAPLLRPYIQAMCTGGQSRESLPSSDAAVMAANAMLLWRCWRNPPWHWAPLAAALGLFALASFGRMYFWAHHLCDVLCGGLLGVLVVICVLHLGWITRAHFLLCFVIFLLALVATQKRTRVFDKEPAAAPVAEA